jgi:hypothetical protein
MSDPFVARWWENEDDDYPVAGEEAPQETVNAAECEYAAVDADAAAEGAQDAQEAQDEEEVYEPIPSYPEGGRWRQFGPVTAASTIEELEEGITAHGKVYGYSFARRQGCNPKPKLGLKYSRFRIYCGRYGTAEPSKASTRKTTTRKINCQWRGMAVFKDGSWVFKNDPDPAHYVHNRPPSGIAALPKLRKATSPEKRAIAAVTENMGIRARDCGSLVKAQFPDSNFTQKDISNLRARYRKEQLGGLTPIGALISLFDEKGVNYVAKFHEDDPDRLQGHVISLPAGEDR